MEEDNIMELRSSRSRSNTPFIRASRDRESTHGNEENKRVTSTHTKASRQRGGSRQKATLSSVTESHTSEVSVTSHRKINKKTGNESDSSTENTVDEPKSGRRSDRQKAKRRLLVNGALPPRKSDDDFPLTADVEEEEMKRGHYLHKTSDYSSEEGEGIAYQVYKRAGDWWNKFPKTDYTYSPISPHRKEVAPGIIAMPNMSRKSLNAMREQDILNSRASKTVSSVSKHHAAKSRWFDETTSGSQASRKVLEDWTAVDSDVDEVMESFKSKKTTSTVSDSWTITTVTRSFFLAIWTFITVTYTRIANAVCRLVGYPREIDIYTTPRRGVSPVGEANPGWLQRLFSYFYRMVCSVMQLDLSLLSSWHNTQIDQDNEVYYEKDDYIETDVASKSVLPHKRNTWRLLLLLLPLLFLAGWWGLSEANENTFNPVIEATDTAWKTLLGWLLIPFEALGALKEQLFINMASSPVLPPIVIPPGDQNQDPQQPAAVDMETLARYIMASSHFQQLLSKEVHMETQAAQKSNEHLESAIHQQEENHEMNVKLLNEQKVLLSQVTNQLHQMEQKMQYLNGEVENVHNNEKEWELRWEKEKEAMITGTSAQHLIDDSDQVLFRKELREIQGRLRLLQEQQAQMTRRCCQRKIGNIMVDGKVIEQHVLKVLADLLGATNGRYSGNPEDLQIWVRNMLLARDDLESRLANLTLQLHLHTSEAVQRSKEIIMASVSDRIQAEFAKWQEGQQEHKVETTISSTMGNWALNTSGGVGLSDLQVRAIVDEALAKYDADKTGLVDYALESSGGSVLNTRCTETYHAKTASLSVLGIPVWWPSNNPRTVIQPGMHPGECWAFSGSQGFIVIKLSGLVKVTAVSMEHIPRSLSPYGRIDSAPKDFSVWGLKEEQDSEPLLLGKYTYQQNGTSLQHFSVQRPSTDPFEMVELRIESNHGNMEYTCLYRFRVHGVLLN